MLMTVPETKVKHIVNLSTKMWNTEIICENLLFQIVSSPGTSSIMPMWCYLK